MIRHLALYSASEAAKNEGLKAVSEKLDASAKTMEGNIAGLKTIEVRLNIDGASPHQFVMYSEFESLKSMECYKNHPLHDAHRDRCEKYVENGECVDIESLES